MTSHQDVWPPTTDRDRPSFLPDIARSAEEAFNLCSLAVTRRFGSARLFRPGRIFADDRRNELTAHGSFSSPQLEASEREGRHVADFLVVKQTKKAKLARDVVYQKN